jgi:uncharacterized membrane protein YjdF
MRRPTWFVVGLAGQAAAVAAYGVAAGNRRVLAYLVVWSVLALLVRAAHRRWPLPPGTIGALAAAGAVHLAGGLLPSPDAGAPIFYETWLVPGIVKFDQAAHAFISGVVTVAVFQALGQVVDERRAGPALRATLAMLVCWGFGAANELFEFLSALRFADAHVGGLDNAGWDLAFNTLGSVLAVIGCSALAAKSRTGARPRPGVAPGDRPRRGEPFLAGAPADPTDVPPVRVDAVGGHVQQQVAMAGRFDPGDVGVGPADGRLEQ